MVRVSQSPEDLRVSIQDFGTGSIVGLVPTMGNLHAGHTALVQRAKAECDIVVATIFINPLQFGIDEDYDGYPQTLQSDIQVLEALDVEILFCPSSHAMYPQGLTNTTTVHVPKLGQLLCGSSRPGHFDGVTTVIAKLFQLVQPNNTYFGEKDWQQLMIIKKMVADLDFSIAVIGVPTVRESDQLALSSRNQFLNPTQRRVAPQLYHRLCQVRHTVLNGHTNYDALEENAKRELSKLGFRPDYVAVRDAETLDVPSKSSTHRRVFAAAHLGATRLIDNISLDSS